MQPGGGSIRRELPLDRLAPWYSIHVPAGTLKYTTVLQNLEACWTCQLNKTKIKSLQTADRARHAELIPTHEGTSLAAKARISAVGRDN